MSRTPARIHNPILIIGVGRSGTTLLYEILARHPDVAWFSNLTDRFPSVPALAALSDLYRRPWARGPGMRWAPKPSEGYRLWAHPASSDDGPLASADLTSPELDRVNRVVAAHLKYGRKSRFLNKNTRNTRCIGFLEEVFDDALFIHVLRDPRAVVASLLDVAFWLDLRIWSENGITPREWEARGRDSAELGASLWAADVARARDDGSGLPRDRYLEVRYEDLVAEPNQVLSEILSFARLGHVPTPATLLAGMRLENRNERSRGQLTAEQFGLLERTLGDVAASYGYVGARREGGA